MEQKKPEKSREGLYGILVLAGAVAVFGLWWLVLKEVGQAVVAWIVTYLAVVWCLRGIFERHHMKGIRLVQGRKYEHAIERFRKSHALFIKYPLMDKYRQATMLSKNKIPYGEMALNNIGVCYFCMGEYEKALEEYEALAAWSPDYPNIDQSIQDIKDQMERVATLNEE